MSDTTEERKMAPVQGWPQGIPWSLHLEAYAAYSKKWYPQKALIEGGCRGGFSTGELDEFIPGWREKASEITALRAEVASLTAENARLKAENEQIRELMNCYNLGGWTDSLELTKERDRLREELSMAANNGLDAARYRWLRDKARSVDWTEDVPNYRMQYISHCRIGGQVMDAAIDAALKENQT